MGPEIGMGWDGFTVDYPTIPHFHGKYDHADQVQIAYHKYLILEGPGGRIGIGSVEVGSQKQ
jgi:hypothetical protein